MDLNITFDELKKNAVKLNFETRSKEDLPIGTSKFGGNPDVPKDFKWFYYEGKDFTGEILNRPLSFLAQINCEEVKNYDKDGLLPSKGILYFFYELATMTGGYDPQHKGSAKVLYFDGDVTELHRANFPEDMDDDFKLPELHLTFCKKYDLTSYNEFIELNDYDDWERYDELRFKKGYEEEEVISKLLGYADIIQNGMLLQCEQVTNEIYCGHIPQVAPEKLEQLQKDCNEWQLLFQLDTISQDDFELMFGDGGRIYFYIKKQDLKTCRFDNCWYVAKAS